MTKRCSTCDARLAQGPADGRHLLCRSAHYRASQQGCSVACSVAELWLRALPGLAAFVGILKAALFKAGHNTHKCTLPAADARASQESHACCHFAQMSFRLRGQVQGTCKMGGSKDESTLSCSDAGRRPPDCQASTCLQEQHPVLPPCGVHQLATCMEPLAATWLWPTPGAKISS